MDTKLKNNQNQAKKTRGGARANSGRKQGVTNKISGATILQSVEKYTGEKFEDLLAQGYHESIVAKDKQTRLQYEKMFLSKVVADKQEMDITSNGKSIAIGFTFPNVELDDWK